MSQIRFPDVIPLEIKEHKYLWNFVNLLSISIQIMQEKFLEIHSKLKVNIWGLS